jgi:transposase
MPKNINFQRKQLNDFEKGRICGLWEGKVPKKTIAKRLWFTLKTVKKPINRYKLTGACARKKGSGRPRNTSSKQNRLIVRTAIKNRKATSKEIKHQLNLDISSKTIRRRLNEANITSCIAVKKPFISKTNLKKRLQWAKEHENWNVDKWKSVLFSDECTIFLHWAGQRLVWRRKNERLDPECTNPTIKHTKKINVWGCFAAAGVGDLYEIEGTLNATKYREILKHHLKKSANRLFAGQDWVFQRDNVRTHTANIVKNYLNNANIKVLPWPSQSPDLNPIENVWAEIKRKTKDCNFTNEKDLFETIVKEWNKLSVPYLNKLIASMPKRCKDLIKNKGYPIKY